MEKELARFILILAFIVTGTTCIIVRSGQEISLKCEFDQPVNCTWTKDSIPITIEIKSRYKYGDGKNGKDTKNCTITISKANPTMDQGNWTCTGKSNNTNVLKTSKSARLDVLSFALVQSPVSQNVSAGQSVVLLCAFNHTVTCSWKRNSGIVAISDRYEYLLDDNGQQTNNCSIKIKNVTEIDSGTWICTTKTSGEHGIQSNPAVISVSTDDKDAAVKPSSAAIGADDKATHGDIFGMPPEIAWISMACVLLPLTLMNTIGVTIICYRLRSMAKHQFSEPLKDKSPIYEEILEAPLGQCEVSKDPSPTEIHDDDQLDVTINVLYSSILPNNTASSQNRFTKPQKCSRSFE